MGMFQENGTKDTEKPISASARKVEYADIGDGIEIKFGGDQLVVRPASAFILRIIDKWLREFDKKAEAIKTKDKEVSDAIAQKLVSIDRSNDEELQKAILDISFDTMKRWQKIVDEIAKLNDSYVDRVCQLIVLEAKNPDWKRSVDSPTKKLLNDAISSEKLDREVSIFEKEQLLSVYSQLNDVEAPRKKLAALRGVL